VNLANGYFVDGIGVASVLSQPQARIFALLPLAGRHVPAAALIGDAGILALQDRRRARRLGSAAAQT
jgi:hypothetical protein